MRSHGFRAEWRQNALSAGLTSWGDWCRGWLRLPQAILRRQRGAGIQLPRQGLLLGANALKRCLCVQVVFLAACRMRIEEEPVRSCSQRHNARAHSKAHQRRHIAQAKLGTQVCAVSFDRFLRDGEALADLTAGEAERNQL